MIKTRNKKVKMKSLLKESGDYLKDFQSPNKH